MRIWKRTAKSIMDDEKLWNAVCTLFSDQNRVIPSSRLRVRGRVCIEVDGQGPFSPGLGHLLEEIARRGTLFKAVDSVKISYIHAWNLIKEAELKLGKELVVPQGGRSELSPDGRRLLDIYRRIISEVPGNNPNSADDYDPEFDI